MTCKDLIISLQITLDDLNLRLCIYTEAFQYSSRKLILVSTASFLSFMYVIQGCLDEDC